MEALTTLLAWQYAFLDSCSIWRWGRSQTPLPTLTLHRVGLLFLQSAGPCLQLEHLGQPPALSILAAFSSEDRAMNLGQFLNWSLGQGRVPVPRGLSQV